MRRLVAVILLVLALLSIPALPFAGKTKIPKGAYGVWEVSATHTKSPLYTSKANTRRENQKIVDKENGALWWRYSKGHAIVDHLDSVVGDGLWRVSDFHVDDIGVLTTKKGKQYYICTAVWKGTQTKYVYKYDGQTIQVKKGDIICVSCADEDGYDYIAYFKKCG